MPRSQTRIASVMEQVRKQIAARAYLPGARLPSVRQQARLSGVSVSTVVEAYERLAAENLIAARPGAGFFMHGENHVCTDARYSVFCARPGRGK